MFKRKTPIKKNITDKDFYDQACSYFYYHAEQRTTMINYFIAVFAAGLALYGSLISNYPIACVLVSAFLFIVSILFNAIDLRNRFDVKQSQNVIAQIEKDYSMDLLRDDDNYVYGVFSNEENVFSYYGYKKRLQNKEFRELRKLHKKLNKKYDKDLENKFLQKLDTMLDGNEKISRSELLQSLDSKSIITLSFSIKMLYYLCMAISLLACVMALIITIN